MLVFECPNKKQSLWSFKAVISSALAAEDTLHACDRGGGKIYEVLKPHTFLLLNIWGL